MTDKPAPIVCRDVTVVYGTQPALVDVSWRAPAAGLVAIIGPNGAGKSTLMRAILGLAPLHSGSVEILGGSIAARRRDIAYVPQRSGLDWDFPATARDVVVMGLETGRGLFARVTAAMKAAAAEKLAEVGLQGLEDKPIGQLSGGQQQRVLIARALAREADILMLDEPFVGVDQPSEQAIMAVFQRLKAKGRLVLCVHHELETVAWRFDHAVLLARKLIAAGPVAEVVAPGPLALAYGEGAGLRLSPRLVAARAAGD